MNQSFVSSQWLVAGWLVTLASCSTLPAAETATFTKSVTEVQGAAKGLFADLSVAERQAYVATQPPLAKYTLKADEAAYYATNSESPETAVLDASFQVLADYAAVLQSYADGTSRAAIKGQLQSLSNDILAILGINGLPADIATALGDLNPLVDQALKAFAATQEKKLVLMSSDYVIALIETMRTDPAPDAMFHLLIWNVPKVGSLSADQNKQITLAKAQVSDFVTLLGKVEQNFYALRAAFDHPSNAVTLASLVTNANEISADIAAARAAYASIRAGAK